MEFEENDLIEFKNEADELLNKAEESLLACERGENFTQHYDAIFRAFHSIKGASGMLGILSLQSHMHQLENVFQSFKSKTTIDAQAISYFLKGIDATRELLKGNVVNFNYLLENIGSEKKTSIALEKTDLPLIYIVDDEEVLLEILEDILKDLKVRIKTFSNPIKALQSFEEETPGVVLVDMKMPNMDGLTLMKEMKKIEKNTSVIILSGYLNKDIVLEAVNLGVFGMMEKPCQENLVLSYVASAIEKQKVMKVLNTAFEMLMFQIVDLEKFLKENKKEETFILLKKEINELMKAKRILR